MNKKDEIIKALNNMEKNEDYTVAAFLITDILNEGSYILFNKKSKYYFELALGVNNIEEADFFKGIVSRKKQIVPKLMSYLDK